MDGHPAMLAVDKNRDLPHGSRPVKGYHGHNVGKLVGDEFAQSAAHPRAFQLKDSRGITVRKQAISGFVIQRNGVEADLHPMAAPHMLQGLLHNRQCLQAQKIHLQQAELLQRPHGKLGHHSLIVCLQQGHMVNQRLAGDDHPGGVDGGVAGQPFYRHRGIQQFAVALLLLVERSQLGTLLQSFLNGDPYLHGDELGHPVHFAVGEGQGPAHIAHRPPGGHGPEGDDLGHPFGAVLLRNIAQHTVALVVGEVDIDIRHGDSLGI